MSGGETANTSLINDWLNWGGVLNPAFFTIIFFEIWWLNVARNIDLGICVFVRKPHTLRHPHASRLVQLGMSIYEVQKILGHADIRTTMRYAHLEEAAVNGKARDLINGLNRVGLGQ